MQNIENAGLLYFVKISSMIEIFSEFAMISMGAQSNDSSVFIAQTHSVRSLDCAPIEILADSLQISIIELIFTKYSKAAFFNILQYLVKYV